MADSLTPHVLAADIGATKTTLALFAKKGSVHHPLRELTVRNQQYQQFDVLLHDFLGEDKPRCACLGVAGPVVDGRVRMTNLNWLLDTTDLATHHDFHHVFLLNDLVATALGVLQLEVEDLHTLNMGKSRLDAVKSVLAPGSGLGEAFLIPLPTGGYVPCASEGAHVSFAPRNSEQVELLRFLWQRQPHVSVEQVCSGLAIPILFDFVATRHAVPRWLQDELTAVEDRTPPIIDAALTALQGGAPCPVALETLQLFLQILADESANLVLKTLSFGGLYLAGGLAPRLLSVLRQPDFMEVFVRGTYKTLLADIPVHVVLNPKTALLGAAAYGLEHWRKVGGDLE